MKKPGICIKLDEIKKKEKQCQNEEIDIKDNILESSPEKQISQDEVQEELSFKDSIKALDERKRKAFINYKWWKWSLKNHKNVMFQVEHELLIKHDDEYQTCSVLQA